MNHVVGLVPLLLMACSWHDTDEAAKCGVTQAQLRQAMGEVSAMAPYSGKDIGRCELIVDDVDNVHVINPEIKRSVEQMMAREEAEAKSNAQTH